VSLLHNQQKNTKQKISDTADHLSSLIIGLSWNEI